MLEWSPDPKREDEDMTSVPTISSIRKEDVTFAKWMMCFGWVFIFGALPWFVVEAPMSTSTATKCLVSSVVSLLLGWFLGYKRGIGPTGVILENKPKEGQK